MSVATNRNGLRVSVPDGDTTGEHAGYTRAFNPEQVLTKSVDGSNLVITTKGFFAGGIKSLVWQGQEFIYAPDHGQGLQWAYIFIPAADGPIDGNNFSSVWGFYNAPGEGGNSDDGASTDLCSSDMLETWRKDDGLGIITTVNPANWGDPTDFVAPIPLTTRKNGSQITRCERIIGYGGNDHIVQSTNFITYPAMPGYDWTLQCDMTNYKPRTVFTRCFSVDPTNGTTVEVFPDTSGTIIQNQTKPYIWTNAGQTLAGGVYIPPSSIGPYGFYATRGGNGTYANAFHFRGPAQQVGGIPAGTATHRAFHVYGTMADAVAAIQQLYGDFP